jgi:hypothetical protein
MSAEAEPSSTTCPDSHRCYNGAPCVENALEAGSYICNCGAIQELAVYDGLACEHKATVYCSTEQKVSAVHYCTNGGTCRALVVEAAAFAGCLCPDGYKGDVGILYVAGE